MRLKNGIFLGLTIRFGLDNVGLVDCCFGKIITTMFTPTSEIFGFSLDDGLFGRIREQGLSGNDNLLATMTEVVTQNNLGRLDQ